MESDPFASETEISREKPVPTQPGRNGGTLYAGSHGKETGRPKGSKNRATILNKFMDIHVKRRHPISGVEEEKTIEEWIELEMIAKALEERDLGTWKEIKDTRFGKITDNVNLTGDLDLSQAVKISIGFDEPTDEQPTDGT